MQVSVQNGDGQLRHMTVELSQDEIYQEVEKRLKELARTAKMNGFRPGKVPTKLLRARYAKNIQKEVLDEKINASFHAAAEQEQLRAVNFPEIELNMPSTGDTTKLSYTATFEVYPNIAIPPLDSYTVYRPVVEITETDVDAMLENFRLQRRIWRPVDRPAQQGDRINISLRINDPSTYIQHKEAKNLAVVLGSGDMIQELEAGLLGIQVAESREIVLPVALDTKTAETTEQPVAMFTVTAHDIAEGILPIIDADFAKSFGSTSCDLDSFRDYTRINMRNDLEEQIRNAIKWQVMSLLLETNKIQPPKFLVEQETTALLAEARRENKPEPTAAWLNDQANRRVRLKLIVGELVQRGTITLDAGRVQSTLQKIASSYEDPAEAIRNYSTEEMQKTLESFVLEEQTVDWVLTQVQIQDKPSSLKELMSPVG